MKVLFPLSLPATLLGLLWLNMRTRIDAGGESMTSVGFPFPWVAPDFSSSMAYIIAWGPLAADLGFWLLACYGLIGIALRKSKATRLLAALSIALWLGAAASLATTALSLSMTPRFVPWDLGSQRSPAEASLSPGRSVLRIPRISLRCIRATC